MGTRSNLGFFKDIPDLLAATRERTGRDVEAIAADLACAVVNRQDIQATIAKIVEDSKTEAQRVGQKAAALRMASEAATIKAAGVLIRRVEPTGEAKALLDEFAAKVKEGNARVAAMQEKVNALAHLIEAFIGELGRAGVPRGDVQALLDKSTYRRVAPETEA